MLALQLAWRFLREGRTQSLLILAGVTIGIAAFVFVSAIIEGLQVNLLEQTLGSQAHLTVAPEEALPRALMNESGVAFARRIEPSEPRRRPFDQWQRSVRRVEATEGVVATCPKVSGSALAYRGAAEEAVKLVGADADRLRQIVDLRKNLVEGTYRLGGEDAVIGTTLAQKLGARVGDPVRVRSGDRESLLRIVGIFEVGSEMVNGRWLVTSLRNAQTLLNRVGDITEIDARVAEVYEAERIASEIEARTGVPTESWMERNRDLLTGLRSQDASTTMIRVFVLLAVAMGIASVLSVTVVQRRGQIGILRAVGTSRRIVLSVFLWQGLLFGVAGALFGSMLGAVAGELIESSALFDVSVTPRLLLTALGVSVATGVLAAYLPARRAANLDPAAAIRGDE
ncbi:MAG: ABC transporter permease [Deltaproteobacteria bacterium]|nr:ABC transporter permease [Deltaproteobacteria bacterium]MBT8465684.1 ABC transporter permease [Deltaproteobacteria bacterium]MBT8481920.1 ABC transporter permease [Deltaproteobacteria bacterium]NNK09249.1 ABC transporter permease [Myxococcales bacterium]NNL24783.1 ABC transporter permease [Myxococcales bacterium]